MCNKISECKNIKNIVKLLKHWIGGIGKIWWKVESLEIGILENVSLHFIPRNIKGELLLPFTFYSFWGKSNHPCIKSCQFRNEDIWKPMNSDLINNTLLENWNIYLELNTKIMPFAFLSSNSNSTLDCFLLISNNRGSVDT